MSMVDAVLLIAFGGPERPEDIRPFLHIVTEGRRIPPERLEEVGIEASRLSQQLAVLRRTGLVRTRKE